MSDSETDLLPNSVSFQSQGTTIRARGPHINSANISSLSFRNNVMTSTMNMPWNQDRPRYAESMYDQRSMSLRREREVSPMSFQSASGMQPRNFQHSYYHRERVRSHRSMYNGRSGSPMSVRSVRTIDSNTSLSAKDIVFALQNGSFNKFDKEMIRDAYNKCFKSRFLYRKRVEKKRNIRKFLNGFRRKSGGDSGDQASDSSISSDDCRSTRTARSMYRRGNTSSCRSTRTNLTDFRRELQENDMVRDITDNFRQNSFKNILPVAPLPAKKNTQPKWQPPTSSQKENFRSGFLLPSERFNQSVASSNSEKPRRLQSINEDDVMLDKRYTNNNQKLQETKCNVTDSENDEEIFGEVTVMEKNNNGKRNLVEQNIPVSAKKRSKLSPQTHMKTINKSKDFIFAKPQLPLKKASIIKSQPKTVAKKPQNKVTKQTQEPKEKEKNVLKSPEPIVEKLISSSQKTQTQAKLIVKSTHHVNTKTSLASTSPVAAKVTAHDPQEKEPCPQTDITLLSATDMSVRPSFIKRKLFTQKVADAEKNSSSDSIQADSPQKNIYSKIQKEKNKARKLASQSCLNRDVADHSNLLDLIHKIVPPDQMNITAINRSEFPNNKSKPVNHTTYENDKWDVTSIISTCNNKDNVSDTFTDEEIFANDSKERLDQNKVTKQKKVLGEDTTVDHQSQKNDKIHKKNTSNDKKKKKNNEEKKDKQKDTNTKVSTEKQALTQNDTFQKTTPPKFLVVIQRLPEQNNASKSIAALNNQVSPNDGNGSIKANVNKAIKSFWDTDVESDFDATPVKKISPLKNGTTVSRHVVETVIESVPTMTKFLKPINDKLAINKATGDIQKQNAIANQGKSKPVRNKSNKDITSKKTSSQNLSKIVTNDNNSNKGKKIVPPPSTKEISVKQAQQNPNKSVSTKVKKILPKGKENIEEPKQVESSKIANTTSKIKPKVDRQKTIKKSASNSTINNDSQHLKVHNNTMRIRAQRIPKIRKCCDDSDEPVNNSTHYRSLRSRLVDLSSSINSDVHNTSSITTTIGARLDSLNNKAENRLSSDVSFTLTLEKANNIRNKKASARTKVTQRKDRQSDVSFTLESDEKLINNSKAMKSTKRNREVETLLNNSLSLFKSNIFPLTENQLLRSRRRPL